MKKNDSVPMRHVLDFSTMQFAPEGDLIASLARRGWLVGVMFTQADGYTVSYSNLDRRIAGHATSSSLAEAVTNAFADVMDLVEGT